MSREWFGPVCLSWDAEINGIPVVCIDVDEEGAQDITGDMIDEFLTRYTSMYDEHKLFFIMADASALTSLGTALLFTATGLTLLPKVVSTVVGLRPRTKQQVWASAIITDSEIVKGFLGMAAPVRPQTIVNTRQEAANFLEECMEDHSPPNPEE